MNASEATSQKGLWRRLGTSTVAQVLFIFVLWQVGQAIVQWAHIPLPGSVIALAILLILFATKLIQPQTLQRGAQWLLAELILFAMPSVLSLTAHAELFGRVGMKLLGAVLVGTLVVMCVTALAVDLFYRCFARAHE